MRTEQEFDTVFLAHSEGVYRLLLRVVRQPQQAEDLVQETFMRLVQHSETIRNEELKPWLYRVAANLGVDHLRHQERRTRWAKEAHQEGAPILHRPTRDAAKVTQVHMTLKRLPERHAKLLLLYSSGLSHKELAEAMEVKASSLSQMLLRAKRNFRKAYEAQ